MFLLVKTRAISNKQISVTSACRRNRNLFIADRTCFY